MTPLVSLLPRSITLALLTVAAACGGASSAASAPDLRSDHDMILVDEGHQQIHRVNLRSQGGDWDVGFEGKLVRDVQLVGRGRLLASVGQAGYAEIDLTTGRILKTWQGFGAQTARRTRDGHTWLGQGNTIVELDAHDTELRRFTVPGAFIKVMRHSAAGTLFIGAHDRMLEVDHEGKILRTWVTGADDSYLGVRLATDEVVIASGKALDVQIFNRDGTLLRRIGPGNPDYTRIGGKSWAGFQILPNRDIILTTWQGHGANGHTGIQVAQFDWSGRLVWHWQQDPKRIASLHGILVLDGLDLNRLHDSPHGILEPVD